MSKSGKFFIVLAVIAVIAMLGWIGHSLGSTQQTAITGPTGQVAGGGTQIVTAGSVLANAGFDADAGQSGSLVSGTISCQQQAVTNGVPGAWSTFTTVTSGTTSVSPGTNLVCILTNATSYHNAVYNVTAQGTNTNLNFGSYKNATIGGSNTITILNSNNAPINGTGPITNQTVSSGTGATDTINVVGPASTWTQPQTIIVEVNRTAIPAQSGSSSVTLTRSDGKAVTFTGLTPSVYNPASGYTTYTFYDVAGNAGGQVSYALSVQPVSGQTLAVSSATVTFYSNDYFKDPAGYIGYGVQDSQGNLKSLGVYNAKFWYQ